MSDKIDKRGKLEEMPFSYQTTKNGSVMLYCKNRMIKTVSGKEAARFLQRVAGATEHEAQLVMAKITGNFKHGNEKRAKR